MNKGEKASRSDQPYSTPIRTKNEKISAVKDGIMYMRRVIVSLWWRHYMTPLLLCTGKAEDIGET